MSDQQSNNPFHGMTLENILTTLVDHYGWDEMGIMIHKKVCIKKGYLNMYS